jgi:hypothetical protein
VQNRVFFPQEALDQLVHDDRVDLVGNQLVIRSEQRKYRVVEAVRILKEVTGGLDTYELVGKVKTVSFVTELGAEVLDTSMVLGDLAYEVIPGFMGAPIGSLTAHRQSVPPVAVAGALPENDEDMLAQYLMARLE